MAVILHFKVKTVLINGGVPINEILSAFFVVVADRHGDFGASTARKANDSLVVLLHDTMINAGFIVFTMNLSF